MPISKNESRALHDSIYTDMQDLRDIIKSMFNHGSSQQEIMNVLNNSVTNIPSKAVRLMGKNIIKK